MTEPATLGKFIVLSPLGQGAMGKVYLGRDPDIGREVAIKVMTLEADEESRERFRNEARAIGQLSHPNIVQVYEFGFHQDQPYLVMEYMDGESLDRWLSRRPARSRRLSVLLDLCRAVEHAHQRGVLHRDIKPSNVQVQAGGAAKLMDFGIARAGQIQLTATGVIIGTPQYLAPEILEQAAYSPASDRFALALVAYETLSDRQPFKAPSLQACITRVLTHAPAPLAELAPSLPAALCGAIDVMLSKDPDDRPSDLSALIKALQEAQTAEPDLVDEISPTRTMATRKTLSPAPREVAAETSAQGGGRKWLAAALVTLLAGLAVIGLSMRRGDPAPEIETAAVASGSPIPPVEEARQPQVESGGSVGAAGGDPGADLEAAPAAADAGDDGAIPPVADASSTSAERAEKEARARSQAPAEDAPDPSAGAELPARGVEAASTLGGSPPGSARRSPSEPRSEPPPRSLEPPSERIAASTSTDDETRAESAVDPPAPVPRESQAAPSATAAIAAAESDEPALDSEVAAELVPPAEEPAPRLVRLLPSQVRRGSNAVIRVEGEDLDRVTRVEVRRGSSPESGIRIRRQETEAAALKLVLFVDQTVPLGLYQVVAIDASGHESALALEISL